jgi:hypothetical protein
MHNMIIFLLLRCITISNLGEGRGGRNIINYSFIYNTKKIEENNDCTLSTVSNHENGVNKILVVVLKSDPYVNALLENSSDYYKLNISQQDTTGILCSQF